MSASKFETELLIKAGVKGLESIARLGKEIESAGVDVSKLTSQSESLNKAFNTIEQNQGLINTFRTQKAAVVDASSAWKNAQSDIKQLAKDWQAAESKAATLKAEIDAQSKATKAQSAAYKKASAEAAKLAKSHSQSVKQAGALKSEYTKLNTALSNTRKTMTDAGLASKDLASQEQQLSKETKSAEQALAKLNDEAKKLQAIAKARVTLGIDTDDRARKQLIEVTNAYEILKKSGKLTNAELSKATNTYINKVKELEAQINKTSHEMSGLNTAGNKLNTGFGGASKAVAGLSGLLATLGVTVGSTELLGMADDFKTLEARIKLATGEGANFISGFEGVKAVADSTYTSLQDTGELFARITKASEDMALAQDDVLKITESINQAIKLSGGTAESNQAAITQLIQGLQSGVVRGEEFNSIMEQAPRLAQAMADGLGVTTGELRAMANEGALTSKVVINAIQTQSQAIQEEFATLPVTAGNSLNQLKNTFLGFVGELDQELNSSSGAASMIQKLATSIDEIDPVTIDAVKQAFSQLGEIAVSLGEQVMGAYHNASDMINIFSGATDASEQVGLITKAFQQLSIIIGMIADGLKGIQITSDIFAGGLVKGVGVVAEAWAKLRGNSTETADALIAKGDELLARAQKNAVDFESSTVAAANNAAMTLQERMDETAQKSREAYEQMAADGTASAGKIQEAYVKAAVDAINANDNVIDARLEAELTEKNLQATISETGQVAITVMQDTKQALDDITLGGVLKRDLDDASASFKALNLDANEFATGLNSKTTAALKSFSTVAELAGDNTEQLARAYSAASASAGNSAQAQALLEQRLLASVNGNTELANAVKRTAIEQQNAKSATDAQADALNRLGINMDAVNQQMSASGAETVKALRDGVTAIKEQAISAEALKIALAQALDVSIAAAKTEADFEAINDVIRKTGVSAKVSSEQLTTVQAGIQGGGKAAEAASVSLTKQRVALYDNAKASTINSQASQSNASAKDEQAKAADKAADSENKAAAASANATSKYGKGLPLFLSAAHKRITSLNDLGVAHKVAGQLVKRFNEDLASKGGNDWLQIMRNTVNLTKEMQAQTNVFRAAKIAADKWTQKLGAATVSSNDLSRAQTALNRATTTTIDGIVRMDDQTLSNLKRAIDGARLSMQGLADDAKDTADSLEVTLEQMRGNDDKAREIEQTKRLSELEDKLNEARARGNNEEIKQLNRALNLQKQINVEEDKQARKQAAEQRQREQQTEQQTSRAPVHQSPTPISQTTTQVITASDIADATEALIAQGRAEGAQYLAKQLRDELKRRAI